MFEYSDYDKMAEELFIWVKAWVDSQEIINKDRPSVFAPSKTYIARTKEELVLLTKEKQEETKKALLAKQRYDGCVETQKNAYSEIIKLIPDGIQVHYRGYCFEVPESGPDAGKLIIKSINFFEEETNE